MSRKKQDREVENLSINNFVKKYMDRLTKPQTHKSGKDYNRQSFKKASKDWPFSYLPLVFQFSYN